MKKRILLATFVALLVSGPTWAVEDLTLTSPVTKPNITVWRFDGMSISRSAHNISTTFLEPTTGETKTCTETGAAADTLLSNLNTANLTANSLVKRATNRAITTGCLTAGTIAGTPD